MRMWNIRPSHRDDWAIQVTAASDEVTRTLVTGDHIVRGLENLPRSRRYGFLAETGET